MEVQHTKVKSTRWMVGVSIVISIEILKSYGFTILMVLNDYDSTQNRCLVKSRKIAHLSFSFINLAYNKKNLGIISNLFIDFSYLSNK